MPRFSVLLWICRQIFSNNVFNVTVTGFGHFFSDYFSIFFKVFPMFVFVFSWLLHESVVGCQVYSFLCTKCIFVQIISQVVVSLS